MLVVHGVFLGGKRRCGLAGLFGGEGRGEEREGEGRSEKSAEAEHGWIILWKCVTGKRVRVDTLVDAGV
jgi:hypothetical protein